MSDRTCEDAFRHKFAELCCSVDFAKSIFWSRLFFAKEILDVLGVTCRQYVASLVIVVLEERIFEPCLGGVGSDLIVCPEALCIWSGELPEGLASATSCLVSVLVGHVLVVLGANLLQF